MYSLSLVIGFVCILIQILNTGCTINDHRKEKELGCYSPIASAFFSALAPLFFNVSVILMILPALLEFKKNSQETLSLRNLILYDGWRAI